MDGASKFVRGDAIAGILILFINIIGGFVIGVAQHDLSARAGGQHLHPARRRRRPGRADPGAADLGGRGDGRVARRQGPGHRRADRQAAVRLAAVRWPITAGVLGVLGLIPGMPHFVFLLHRRRHRLRWPGGCARRQQARGRAPAQARGARDRRAQCRGELGRPACRSTRSGLEVGYRLIPLVDKARAAATCWRASRACARSSRRTSASCRRRCTSATTSSSSPACYRITLRGVVVGEGEAFPGMWLAINPGGATQAAARHARPPIRPSACPRCGSRNASARWPRWPGLRWLIARPSWPPTFHT